MDYQRPVAPFSASVVGQRLIISGLVTVAHLAIVAMVWGAGGPLDQPPLPHVIRLQIASTASLFADQPRQDPIRAPVEGAQEFRPPVQPVSQSAQSQAARPVTPVTPTESVGRAATSSTTNNRAVSEDRQPTIDASFRGNQPPVYPIIARRRGEQGTVILRVLITPDGRASDVELVRGSGSAHLDRSAIETIRQWRFVPAIQGGRPAAAWYEWRWEFRLEG